MAQAEALGVLDDHQRGVRHVHADLDHGRGDKDIRLAAYESGHDRVLILRLHAAVDAGDLQLRELLCQLLRVLLGGFELALALLVVLDLRTDDEALPSLPRQLADEAVQACAVALVHGEGVHLLPSGRQLVDDRYVEIAVDHQRERARDGRGGHDEHVRPLGFADERRALAHAEAVLLVRDDQAEAGILHVLGKKGVRADHEVIFSSFNRGLRLALFLCGHRAGQLADAHPEGGEEL